MAGIKTTVTFDAEVVSDEVLKCGWLAGKKMPVNKAPFKGVELHWEFLSGPLCLLQCFQPNGTLAAARAATGQRRTTSGCRTYFSSRGFVPVSRGPIKGRDLMVTVSARIVTADIPTPGSLGPGLILKLGPGDLESSWAAEKDMPGSAPNGTRGATTRSSRGNRHAFRGLLRGCLALYVPARVSVFFFLAWAAAGEAPDPFFPRRRRRTLLR